MGVLGWVRAAAAIALAMEVGCAPGASSAQDDAGPVAGDDAARADDGGLIATPDADPNRPDADPNQPDADPSQPDADPSQPDAAPGQPDATPTSSIIIDTAPYLPTDVLNASDPMGVILNGLQLDPLNGGGVSGVELEALASSSTASNGDTVGEVERRVLAYVYSCALPAGTSMELTIGADVYEFQGALGLAPQWATGPCDIECQQWVSACVFARTNQYAVPIEVSLRGDHAQLQASPQVEAEFSLREGSYYGNLFTGTPIQGNAYACAGGEGGAIPQLTQRFCSAFGDGCPVETVADCNINEFACDATFAACSSFTACDQWDADGHPTRCYDEAHVCGQTPSGTAYTRIITAYLRPPVHTCGDGICAEAEADACPADCADHWARRFGSGCHEDSGGLSVDASGNVAITGRFVGDITFGSTHSTSGDSDIDLFVAVLDSDGDPVWSRAMDASGNQTMARTVATDSAGNVIVAGHFASTLDLDGTPVTPGGFSYFIAKYSAATGAPIWTTILEGDAAVFGSELASLPDVRIEVDFADGVVFATDFPGTIDLGLSGNKNPSAGSFFRDILVARFDADGDLDWHRTIGGTDHEFVRDLALDDNDNIVVGGSFKDDIDFGGGVVLNASGPLDVDGFVAQLSPLGATLWAAPFNGATGDDFVSGVATDGSTVVATGAFRGTMTIDGGAQMTSVTNPDTGLFSRDVFVAGFDADGNALWSTGYGGGRTDEGRRVVTDPAGGFVVALRVANDAGETVSVEGTVVDSGELGDIVLVHYAPSDGQAGYVSQHGSPVAEDPIGLAAGADGELTVSGEFMGTVRFGGTYLTNAGGSLDFRRPADVFVFRLLLGP